MWTRILFAGLAAGVLALTVARGGALADELDTEQWRVFAQQQPLLSRMLVANQTSAIAQLFGISAAQLTAEMAGHSLVELAAAHGRTESDVAAVMLDTANQDLQLAAMVGLISQDARADLKAQFEGVLPSLISTPAPPVLALN